MGFWSGSLTSGVLGGDCYDGESFGSLHSSHGGTPSHSRQIPKCFDILPFPSIKCRIHPVVVFTILDAYIRREDDQDYVIGTVMGSVSEGNVVEVTDCFVDRHSLTDTGLLQIIKDHHESMYEHKQKVNPKEQVVGWFCTGSQMTELTCAVHGWFKSFSSVSKFQSQPPLLEPIHLMLDATLSTGRLDIKAFLQVPILLVKDACFQFQEVAVEIHTSQAEKAGMSVLLKSRLNASSSAQALQDDSLGHQRISVPPSTEKSSTSSGDSAALCYSSSASRLISPSVPALKDGFHASLDRLAELLDVCSTYVCNVLDGSRKPDSDIGRSLMKALCSEALMDSEQFDQMCQTSLHDTLMVAYLASLARLQFAVAEKLNTSFF